MYNLLITHGCIHFEISSCSKWGEIIMDDAQCGENIKAWGCAIIVNGTKETNLKWWATINRKVTITISEVFHVFFRQRSKKFLVAIFAFIISFYISFYIQFIIYNFSYNFWLSSHVLDTYYSKNKEDSINCQ